MKKNKLFEAMDSIDDRHLERYVEVEERISAGGAVRTKRRRALVLIAALLSTAILCGVFAVLSIGNDGSAPSIDIPTYDGAFYTAEQVASVFDGPATDAVKTNAYVEIEAPSVAELGIIPIPDSEYMTVYKRSDGNIGLDLDVFKDDINGILERASAVLREDFGELGIDYDDGRYSYDGKGSYIGNIQSDDYRFYFSHTQSSFSATLHAVTMREDGKLSKYEIELDGVTLSVDQRQSDEEIIDSLAGLKESIFDIFGVEFSDAEVVRSYSSWSENGVERMYVYLYNESDCSINPYVKIPRSDHIMISFDNFENYSGDVVSDGVLSNCDVKYVKNRVEPSEKYVAEASVKLIPLEVAEQLLYRGYVFGGHSCPLCMEEQEDISFEDYDAVGITYLSGEGDDVLVIPFYVFYKKIGDCKNGNITYARTYVPAVEVSGLEEYFDMQKDSHKEARTEFFA